jgi:hypothetical protein
MERVDVRRNGCTRNTTNRRGENQLHEGNQEVQARSKEQKTLQTGVGIRTIQLVEEEITIVTSNGRSKPTATDHHLRSVVASQLIVKAVGNNL